MTRKTPRATPLLSALAAALSLGVVAAPAQAPAPTAPPTVREFVVAPTQRKARRAKVALPKSGAGDDFPVTGDIVPGSTNTYRLGALVTKHYSHFRDRDHTRMQRNYCHAISKLRSSRGSQAMMAWART